MISLIGIDLDGTLYTPDHEITPRVREAIHRTIDSGIQIFLVSGRGRRGTEYTLDLLGLDLTYICCAGALIRTGKSGQTISARAFSPNGDLSRITAFTRRVQSGLLAETLERDLWFGPDTLEASLNPYPESISLRPRVRSIEPERDFDQPLLKITFVGDPGSVNDFEELIKDQCPSLQTSSSGSQYLDLTGRGIDKGSALEILAKYMGVNLASIAAIGDQAIDIPMLRIAGLPIAMANAPEEVHKYGQWIAPPNTADGLAWALERILEQNG